MRVCAGMQYGVFNGRLFVCIKFASRVSGQGRCVSRKKIYIIILNGDRAQEQYLAEKHLYANLEVASGEVFRSWLSASIFVSIF